MAAAVQTPLMCEVVAAAAAAAAASSLPALLAYAPPHELLLSHHHHHHCCSSYCHRCCQKRHFFLSAPFCVGPTRMRALPVAVVVVAGEGEREPHQDAHQPVVAQIPWRQLTAAAAAAEVEEGDCLVRAVVVAVVADQLVVPPLAVFLPQTAAPWQTPQTQHQLKKKKLAAVVVVAVGAVVADRPLDDWPAWAGWAVPAGTQPAAAAVAVAQWSIA